MKKDTTRLYRVFIYVCIIGISCTALIFAAYIIYEMYFGNGVSASTAMSSACIEILGIFAAVVAASYIANVIGKAEIDRMKERMAELTGLADRVSTIKNQVDSMEPLVNSSKNILFNSFMETLDRLGADIASAVMAENFRRAHEPEAMAERGELYLKLTEIEQIYAQTRSRHASAYSIDNALLELADKGTALITALKNELPKITDKAPEDELIDRYLALRSFDFDFYRGYCERDRAKGAEAFLKAAKQAKECSRLELYKGEDQETRNRLTAFFENIIGECYSKVGQYYSDALSDPALLKTMNSIPLTLGEKSGTLAELIDTVAQLAIAHCDKACSTVPAGDASASTYHRNLGCAYERQDRISCRDRAKCRPVKKCPLACLIPGKPPVEPAGNTFENYDKAVSSYRAAVRALKENYGIKAADAANAYYTLLSYYKKNWDALFPNDGDPAEHVNIPRRIGPDKGTADAVVGLAADMYQTARLAKLDIPRDPRLHYLYGFSCAYLAILAREELELGPGCNSARYYISEVQETLNAMDILEPGNKFNKPLRNYLRELKNM